MYMYGSLDVWMDVCNVDLDIFVVKIFLWFQKTQEKKNNNTKYILQLITRVLARNLPNRALYNRQI